jgi:class 3 adenylate cyclase
VSTTELEGQLERLREQQRALSNVLRAVENAVDAQPVGEIDLKGFGRPVAAYEVRALRP